MEKEDVTLEQEARASSISGTRKSTGSEIRKSRDVFGLDSGNRRTDTATVVGSVLP